LMAFIYESFCELDLDGSGKLDKSEYKKMVDAMYERNPDVFSHDKLLATLTENDGDQDGKLSWVEFYTMVTGEAPPQAKEPSEQ